MSTETEKILNSLDNVEEKLNYAEKVALWYDTTEEDKKIARNTIIAEAGKQNPHADFLMYKLLIHDKIIISAMDWLKRAYKQGYPKALAFTYFEYLHGYATFVSDNEARTALFTAIEQNVPAAHYFLGYALYNLSFLPPKPKYPPNLSEIEHAQITAEYIISGQRDIDWDNAKKRREEAGDSAYRKAKGLGFSEKEINWSCHEQTVIELTERLVYDMIITAVFSNTPLLLNQINNGTVEKYLKRRCVKKFNEVFSNSSVDLEFYRPLLKVKLIDINSSRKYCLFIELIEKDHKFLRMVPIYYMAVLDRSGSDDIYLFTGNYGYSRFNEDLYLDNSENRFELEAFSNNEMWIKKKWFKELAPQEITDKKFPCRYTLSIDEYINLKKKDEANHFINHAIEFYKLTRKRLSDKFIL
ncbi:MAG: sel1 repeat family protein [Clostridia bacterium]|nr:sel1 repeat family protein [Clostridia bacterium]